jgi:dTDP-4-dehydrorhamnose reductase
MRVVVLGASGMLGSMLTRVLAAEPDLDVVACARDPRAAQALVPASPTRRARVSWKAFDVEAADDGGQDAVLDDVLKGAAWTINAIGVIKSFIRDTNPADVERAVRVNALFPHRLARAAERQGCSVLQIATDCVWNGARGAYTETDPHDAHDVYGKTKSLGEVPARHVHHLRASIIGPELSRFVSLLEWFRRQPPRATVNGFVNHQWNGITTLTFARIALAVVRGQARMSGLQHLIPADTLSKHDLLLVLRDVFDRGDVTIRPTQAADTIDRTLRTNDPAGSAALWAAAGYAAPPIVADMVRELGAWLAAPVEA